MSSAMVRAVLTAAFVCATVGVSQAQTTSTSTETKSFEVLTVDGHTLVVRLPEGTRELTVADDFRFTVNGQQLSVQQLKPGMKGTATVTTKTTVTPVTVTEVKNGTVAMQTGMSIIVRTEEGIKSFTQGDIDKRGVKIYRSGKPAQISDFREGDKLSATIITSKPPTVLTEKEVQATLASAGGGAGATAAKQRGSQERGRQRSASASGGASGSASGGGAKTLPKTASHRPLVGFGGAASLLIGIVLAVRRRLRQLIDLKGRVRGIERGLPYFPHTFVAHPFLNWFDDLRKKVPLPK